MVFFYYDRESADVIIDAVKKYQKIEQIMTSPSYAEYNTVYSYTYDSVTRLKHIREVLNNETGTI